MVPATSDRTASPTYKTVAATWAAVGVSGFTVTGPGSRTTPVNTATSLQIQAECDNVGAALTYSATGLPTRPVNPAGTDLTGTHTVVTGGKALDDPNHSTAAGTQLITWTANGGTNQNWQFTRQPDGSYQVVNGLSGLCADVSGGSTTAGAPVVQWTCTGGTSQHWILTSDNAPVTQQMSNGSATQQWTIQ
ncbi:RICIN domain-containing protein [Kitasatospora sp. NPDC057015]|uniref:RICIN domain-containing protein n=1 Tax=Kitasatospora sp. NPDC057015 TaxID=3346001 RepID=UPI00363311A8